MRGGRRRVLALAAAVAAVGGLSAGRARASDNYWNNPLGGSFHDNANWVGGVPGILDNAVFDLGSLLPYAVSLSSDVSNNQVRIGNDLLQLAFTPGVTFSLASTSPTVPAMIIGDAVADVGQLTLLDATILTSGQMVIGADGTGTLIVPGTSRISGADAFIGFSGTGHLLLQAGGKLDSNHTSIGTNTGADGSAVVDGLNSIWTNNLGMFVGDFGSGELTVSNFGFVRSEGIYGGFAGTGSIIVDSNATLNSSSFIRIGDTATGNGSLQITGGGSVASQNGSIAFAGGAGSVLVDGSGSNWLVTDALEAGWSGVGTLTIQNGGGVAAAVLNIGSDLGGDGTVSVSGTGSNLSVGGILTIGKDGKGQLAISAGGAANTSGGVIGQSSADPNVASVSGSGSSWNMGANQLVVGADGSGSLEISSGATVTNGPAILGRGASGTGTVVLEQPGTSWTSNGLLNIGLNGNGLLQVSGGAQVNGTSAVIGGDAVSGAAGSGAVAFSGINSTWNLSSQLIVGGGAGIGSISLDGGAKLTDASATVGDGAGSTGIFDLLDLGTTWTTSGAVRVGNNGTGDVTVGAGASVISGSLDVGINAAGDITVVGSQTSWTSSGPIRVGISHFGTLLIDARGTFNDSSATIGSGAGGIGQVIVNGTGSTWNNSGTLNVGRGEADGVVTIQGGGGATSGPSNIGGDGASLSGNGAVIVKGAGSHWTATAVTLGLGGSGDLEALSGGVIDAASLVISNGPASSLGFAKVQDAGSKINVTGNIEVGRDVNGTLDVSSGGLVTSASGVIGTLPSATGTAAISGAGSRWTIGGDLDLAVNGAGVLSVSGGGVVSGVNAFVGRGPSGSGTATISGASSQWTLSDSLYIGGDNLGPRGNGMVSVASTATVAATNQIKIWATGTLDLNNGNVSTALVDLQGGLISGNGTLASPVSSTNGRVSTSATIALTGPLSIVAGSNLTKQGTGTLRIDGPQNHGAAATLNVAGGAVQLNTDAGTPATAATAASANLIVRVSGSNVTLGANQELMGLNVEFANPLSQSFDLATPATAGAFRSVRLYPADLVTAKTALYSAIRNANAAGAPDPADGIFDSGLPAHPNSKLGMARLTDLHGDPYILIRPTRIGDLNLDGQVTISDFIDLASNFNGTGKTWQEGDLNYDGSVTISDFIDLASNFGASYTGQIFPISPEDQLTLATFASSIGAAVPEPASATLFLGLGATLLATRRRRR